MRTRLHSALHAPAALLALLLPFATAAAVGGGSKLTLEQASGRGKGVSFAADLPSIRWAADGVHVQRGSGDEIEWLHPETQAVSAPAAETGGDERRAQRDAWIAALKTIDGVDDKAAARIAGGRRSSSDDDAVHLFERDDVLYLVRLGAEPGARRLTREERRPELAELAPDGEHVAFVEGNDLYVVDTKSGRTRALTSDGDDETFNGKLDWVYQEEVYGRGNFKGFWWSPTGDHIAFLRLDEHAVHEFTVVDHIEKGHFRVKPEVTNYPKAGDPNPTVMLGIAKIADGTIAWADLDDYRDSEPIIARVGWLPDGSRTLFAIQNRIQSRLDLCTADPESGALATWIHEESDSWVDVLGLPRFLADGSFLWRSARTGFRHLYHYDARGELIRPVTSGAWKFLSIEHLDEQTGEILFTSTRDGAVDSNLYRTTLAGGEPTRLTHGRGRHSVSWNDARTFFLDRFSSLENPGEVWLCRADGERVSKLATATVPAADEYAAGQWELFEVEARDSFPLDVALLKPADFDPSRSYAVWIPTYSGPDAPSVRNSWNSSAWYQFLAQQGVLVMQVNVRTASGKGHRVIEQCYRRLGVQELRDLEDAVEWLTRNPWADAKRVGLTGYSYGGFMTAFALTHSDHFALGVAGGGVYDWRMYDTIYTERYMSTPQLNPEGYQQTSVLDAAANLTGRLLLHCGVMDDNVHMQNTIQLVQRLQKADKDFELMVYPQQRHGYRDRDQRWYSRRMEWRAIAETLLGLDGEASAPPARIEVSSPAPAAAGR